MINNTNNHNYNPSPKAPIKWSIILAVIIIIVIINVIYFLQNSFQNDKAAPINIIRNLPSNDPKRQLAEKRDRPHFGNENAKLVIVEFSDFQCPVCQAEFPIIREIINKYQDQVFFIYRQYPIINETSPIVSQASLCAFDQDKFWPMHDRLFLNANDNFNITELNLIAKQSGLDVNQFTNCLTTEKFKDMVNTDFQDGYALEVPGTPTFFINGDKLSGEISKENWEIIINQSLELLDSTK